MEVPEGVLGADHDTRRLVSDADDTLGRLGAQGGSPADWHSSVTETVKAMVAVPVGVWVSAAVISTVAS